MEEVVEKTEENNPKTKITIWRFFAYFIIYSFLGWIIETAFAFFIMGVLESRKSFLFGPICAIYGLGATVMIVVLRFFDKNNYRLFFAGLLVGTTTEYMVSLIGELWLHMRWWDYSGQFLNINGRISLIYSLVWGILAIVLMRFINPRIDKFIDWISIKITPKIFNIIISIIIVLLFVDWLYSAAAQEWVLIKVSIEKDLNIKDKEKAQREYDKIYSNENTKNFVDKYWTVERMLYAFPNVTKEVEDGRRVYVRRLYPEIHPYYFRFIPQKEGTIYDP